jgi:16S rRNA (guanine1207-N2)-methyltransferase
MPKAKAEAQYLLAMMTPLLESGADLFLAGENRGGINGADKLLAPYGEKPIKRDSARRCSLPRHARQTGRPLRAGRLVQSL